jgi:hypothetical protein
MSLSAWVLAAVLSLPPAYADREETGRAERMTTVANAVVEVTARATCADSYAVPRCSPIWSGDRRSLAALLIAKGWWESRFARNVHEGQCRPDECDAVKWRGQIVHRARSPWQLQRTAYSSPEWDEMVGTSYPATRAAAWAAAKVLSEGSRRCQSPRGALAWYAAGRCTWSGAGSRAATYERLMRGEP